MRRAARVLALVSLAALVAACGMLSDSSRSASKSVSSPLRMSGSSSEREDGAYMREIRDFSFGYAKSGGDAQAFARGVGSLAQRHGITDWESDRDTCRAIGQGVRAAGLDRSASRRLIESLVPANSVSAQWMREGYEKKY